MKWRRVDTLIDLWTFGAGRPIVRETTERDPAFGMGYDDRVRVGWFADGAAIAIVTDIEIHGPYSEVTPDVDVYATLGCWIGEPS